MSSPDDYGSETLETFLATCDQFKLGSLVTESPNHITSGLAEAAQNNLPNALQMLQLADVSALQRIAASGSIMPKIVKLADEIHDVLEKGHCVFFEGCGATGRLSLTIEVLAREGLVEDKYRDQIKGFMAGGDAALIRSIEQFEDRRDFGARQLADMGFVDGDLCVAITEGGETTFVIAACEEATRLGPSRKHWFLYCNPDDVLAPAAERSKNVLENKHIEKINLTCGPMAVTGSTRMQATTVQLLVAGLAVQHHNDSHVIEGVINDFAGLHAGTDYAEFANATAAEAELYAKGIPFVYRTDYFTCTVLTDTTERSPTFSLPAFESFAKDKQGGKPDAPSPVYMHLPGTRSAHEAWQRLLRREPRGIDWDECWKKTGNRAIYGYDFSDHVTGKRQHLLSDELVARTDGGKQLAVSFAIETTTTTVDGKETTVAEMVWRVPKASSVMASGKSGDPIEYVKCGIVIPSAWLAPSKIKSTLYPPQLQQQVAAGGEADGKQHHGHKNNNNAMQPQQPYNYHRHQMYAEPLLLNILAKMVLNAHSTALMGRNGRLRSNVMTYVRPSNKKLIDRAARYVILLFNEAQKNFAPEKRQKLVYEDVVREIFEQRKELGPSEPIVVKVLDHLLLKTGQSFNFEDE